MASAKESATESTFESDCGSDADVNTSSSDKEKCENFSSDWAH